DSFKLNLNITIACAQAGVSRETFYQWCEHDQEFSFRYNQAGEMANDVLLAAAWRRAVQGTDKHVVSMGKPVFVEKNGKQELLTEKEYSDAVLLRLMSWRLPGFRETSNFTLKVTPKEYMNLPEDDGVEQ